MTNTTTNTLAQEAARDLALWLAPVKEETNQDAPKIVHAIRMAMRFLADPVSGGTRPELAAEMLRQLDEQYPATYVTVDGHPGTGLRWHLVNANNHPVEAGRYAARWAGRPTFEIEQHPEIQGWQADGAPRCVWIKWVDDVRGYCGQSELVEGWTWQPERI